MRGNAGLQWTWSQIPCTKFVEYLQNLQVDSVGVDQWVCRHIDMFYDIAWLYNLYHNSVMARPTTIASLDRAAALGLPGLETSCWAVEFSGPGRVHPLVKDQLFSRKWSPNHDQSTDPPSFWPWSSSWKTGGATTSSSGMELLSFQNGSWNLLNTLPIGIYWNLESKPSGLFNLCLERSRYTLAVFDPGRLTAIWCIQSSKNHPCIARWINHLYLCDSPSNMQGFWISHEY